MLSVRSLPPTPLVISATVVICLLYILLVIVPSHIRRRKIEAETGCQQPPTYRTSDPFLGLDWTFANIRAVRGKKYLETIAKRFDEVATTYKVRVGRQRAILTIEPENVKTILSLRFKDFTLGNRPAIMGKFLGNGIFVNDGEDWAHSRAFLRPSFVADQATDLSLIETHVQDLFKLIPRDGSTVDLQPLFFRFTLDSATEFLFGHSVRTLQRNEGADEQFSKAFNYSLEELALGFRLGPLRNWRYNPKADAAYQACRDYVDQFVNQAFQIRANKTWKDTEKQSGSRSPFLQELSKATGDRGRIRDEILNVLIAGRDTTASLLSHMIFEISRKPSVWRSLEKEIETLKGGTPSYEELKNMKYVKFVIQESESDLSLVPRIVSVLRFTNNCPALRLHPPVPINTRMCVSDTVLPVGGGRFGEHPVHVPKGTLMIYMVHAMHRRKDFFGPDAEEFRPERWEHQRHSWVILHRPTSEEIRLTGEQEYLPFNGGPRLCLGQQYAMTEASYVLVRMLQEFRAIESRDLEPWREALTLTVCSDNGVKVGLTPRENGYELV